MSRSSNKIAHLNIWFVLGPGVIPAYAAAGSRILLHARDATMLDAPDSAVLDCPGTQANRSSPVLTDGSLQAAVWNTLVAPAPDTIRTPGYPLLPTAGLPCGRLESVTIALQIVLSCFTVYVELVQKNQGLGSKTSCCIENTEFVLPSSCAAGSSGLRG
jgi:hypothetical protein